MSNDNIDLTAETHAITIISRLDPDTRAKLEAWLTPVRIDSSGTAIYAHQIGTDKDTK